jgi:hypothetical protein
VEILKEKLKLMKVKLVVGVSLQMVFRQLRMAVFIYILIAPILNQLLVVSQKMIGGLLRALILA